MAVRVIRHFLVVCICFVLMACGGGGTSSGGGDIFSGGCALSDPKFPFCGVEFVRCRNQDGTLYKAFDQVCPSGWTVVPENVAFPDLVCTNPQGQTFNVDADQCPPGWTEFTFTFLPLGTAAAEF